MSRHLSPDAFEELTDDAKDVLGRLATNFRLATHYVHERRDRPTDENDYSGGKGGVSDPTGSTVVEQRRGLETVRKVAKRTQKVLDTVKHIESHLEGVFAEPEESWTPLRSVTVGTQGPTPRLKEGELRKREREAREQADRYDNRARRLRREAKEAGQQAEIEKRRADAIDKAEEAKRKGRV